MRPRRLVASALSSEVSAGTLLTTPPARGCWMQRPSARLRALKTRGDIGSLAGARSQFTPDGVELGGGRFGRLGDRLIRWWRCVDLPIGDHARHLDRATV